MIITLKRESDDGVGIRGQLLDPQGKRMGYTMEPSVTRAEHPGIPKGTYQLAWTTSPRLKRETLEVCLVPAAVRPRKPVWKFPQDWRAGIRIHPFNQPQESLGCISVGLSRDARNFIGSSKLAVAKVEKLVREAMAAGVPVYIAIV